MDNKGFYSYIMLEFKGFLIGLAFGALITLALYYASSTGLIGLKMPFLQAAQAVVKR